MAMSLEDILLDRDIEKKQVLTNFDYLLSLLKKMHQMNPHSLIKKKDLTKKVFEYAYSGQYFNYDFYKGVGDEVFSPQLDQDLNELLKRRVVSLYKKDREYLLKVIPSRISMFETVDIKEIPKHDWINIINSIKKELNGDGFGQALVIHQLVVDQDSLETNIKIFLTLE